MSVANVNDLYSVPLLIHYNPAVMRVEEVRDGGFLSGGNQQIAIVQRIDEQRGEIVVSATRQPNTPGVNGSGTLIGLVVRAVAPGNCIASDPSGKRPRFPAETDSHGLRSSNDTGAVRRR